MKMANQAKFQQDDAIVHINADAFPSGDGAYKGAERRSRRLNSFVITSDDTHQQHFSVRVPIGIEHRQGKRCNLIALTTIRLRDQHFSGIVTNVSSNGMFVLSDEKFRRNECVDLYISHPRMIDVSLHFPGLVVHSHDNGFGMLFRELNSDAYRQVNWWLSEK